jgi:predicted CoA-binding protein
MANELSTAEFLTLTEAAHQFLDQKVFAVVGVSRGNDDTAKSIYEKLEQTGRVVYAIHPTETIVKGIPCWPSIKACPKQVEAVVVVTKPEHVAPILTEAIHSGIQWAWLHKSFGNSVQPQAVSLARSSGLKVIDGGCPMMFLAPVDGAHACFKHLLTWVGRIPKRIEIKRA